MQGSSKPCPVQGQEAHVGGQQGADATSRAADSVHDGW